MRKVRSETRPTVTPSIWPSASTTSAECSVELAPMVTSICTCAWPESETSSAVTAPPAASTVRVSWLTA
jgi:hypothetical protein